MAELPPPMVAVSMPLSEYLASGNPLSPQEAIVLVSSLSQSINSLHKLGMSPGAIDPDNVMLDCDLDVSAADFVVGSEQVLQ
jgi:serine/threonine protein kinase